MATDIEIIVELQQVMRDLADARRSLEEVPEDMAELHEEHGRLSSEIERLEQESSEAESSRRKAEAEAEDQQGKVEHFQEQVNRVTTQKEYGALLSEIDGARERKRAAEEEALEALERHETLQGELETLKGSFTEIDERYRDGIAAWEEEKPAIRERIANLETRAEILREQLAPPVLARFDRLFERHHGDPLAAIEKMERPGSTFYRCSVCNYQVRPQVVVELRSHGQLTTCECGRQRIFYLPEE